MDSLIPGISRCGVIKVIYDGSLLFLSQDFNFTDIYMIIGGSGGYDYSDWDPAAELWLPGVYEVKIFLGTNFYVSATFTVVGDPPTPTITPTPSASTLISATPEPTDTPSP
jgi:hypothetical protein